MTFNLQQEKMLKAFEILLKKKRVIDNLKKINTNQLLVIQRNVISSGVSYKVLEKISKF